MPQDEPAARSRPDDLLPLTPAVFHIMLALAGGECHGYGIMQEVDKLTNSQMRLGPGTLYRSIQRMVVDGLIEEREEPGDHPDDRGDERRRYYELTALGRDVARAEAARLKDLVDASRIRGLLPDSQKRESQQPKRKNRSGR
jgi:DNA-binding PadR family transcriptional regulator